MQQPTPATTDSLVPRAARKAPLPRMVKPQLASLEREVPTGDGWIHEIKFDGYRILARWDGSGACLLSRNGHDWTHRFPALAASLERLPAEDALLDGEVVALRDDGSSSFELLQRALSDGRTDLLVYQAVDLLHLSGRDLRPAPQQERKEALRRLLVSAGFGDDGTVRYTDHVEGRGGRLLERACELGLEGVVSKHRDAPYHGGRGTSWLKTKCSRHADLVIGGFTDPGGSRSGFGALLLGAWDGERLTYAGKVGTGFGGAGIAELHARLLGLEIDESPFDPAPAGPRGAHWVRPTTVAEVEFTAWTRDGLLRHPVFRGLRPDKDAHEVRLPTAEERAAAAAPADTRRGGRGGGSRGGRGDDGIEVAGVRLSSPDRVLYPEQGVTKLALARYYEAVADWILPRIVRRPLSLVRCPRGHERHCFFQKHPGESLGRGMACVAIEEKDGTEDYLYVRDLPDLIRLVQAGVLELHVWGSRLSELERPDQMVFDLDPGPEVDWSETLRVARELRDRLSELELASLPRTTGGKGLHLVVPLEPRLDWRGVKAFARAVAQAHAADDPGRVTATMAKAERHGRIFLDYLRNGRGATAIASYSPRARPGAPVAVPVRWDELGPALRPDRYHVGNLRRRLAALRDDPWQGTAEQRTPVSQEMLAAVGVQRA